MRLIYHKSGSISLVVVAWGADSDHLIISQVQYATRLHIFLNGEPINTTRGLCDTQRRMRN